MSTIKFDWASSVECQHTKEILEPDSLDRAKYAEYLTNYLSTYRTSSYVLNVNCAWGTGKTYFLKRWSNSIGQKHPVIYLDAWKNDNHNDPLLLVLGEIIAQLKVLLDGESSETLTSVMKTSKAVIRAIAPALAKGLMKKVVNIDFDEVVAQSADNAKVDSKNAEAGAESAVKELLSIHKTQGESIDALKREVERLLSKVIIDDNADGEQRWSPMYIFIDELDRCRPTFAIELLEVVKHIFSMQRVIFVIATDTEQLQHSIRAVYGSGFDSQKYLLRFFDRSFSLPTAKTADYVGTLESVQLLKERIIKTNYLNIFAWDDDNAIAFLAFIFEGFSLDLRSIGQIVERVKGVLANHPKELGVIWLVVLECMRVALPQGYEKMLLGEGVETSGVDNFRNQILGPLNNMAKVKHHAHNHKITIDISATHSQAKLSWIPVGAASTKQILVTDELIGFQLFLNTFCTRYSTASERIAKDPKIVAIDAYIWLTEKDDINRFREYVEIASNLS
ncbi:MAG: hypothetical protein ACI8WB_000539 [Phenylobacterium sp.]|jgi:hypothetical protein